MNGTIHWFCNTSGEGMISAEDGRSYYLHWSAVAGTFKGGHGKSRWVECQSGWKVSFEPWKGYATKVEIVAKSKPRKMPSAYIDREVMKAKLTAAYAQFDELFPEDHVNWDRYHDLIHKKKITKKEKSTIEAIEAEIQRHNAAVRKWNAEKSAVIVSIYREHSRYPWLRSSETL